MQHFFLPVWGTYLLLNLPAIKVANILLLGCIAGACRIIQSTCWIFVFCRRRKALARCRPRGPQDGFHPTKVFESSASSSLCWIDPSAICPMFGLVPLPTSKTHSYERQPWWSSSEITKPSRLTTVSRNSRCDIFGSYISCHLYYGRSDRAVACYGLWWHDSAAVGASQRALYEGEIFVIVFFRVRSMYWDIG